VIRPSAQGGRDAGQPDTPGRTGNVADVLGGTWHEVEGQRFVVVDRTYRPGHRHGDVSVADGLPPSNGLWPTLDLLARTACRPGLLFLDLETTGLMGGAGTYAFLVGCGWFEGGTFRVRQFLMSSVTGERGLLSALAEVGRASGTVVSYNGKSFDLPLIDTRFLFHRLPSPFDGMPHVDMLHPARRLWRPLVDDRAGAAGHGRHAPGVAGHGAGFAFTESACRLATLERTLCGFTREGDVPGFEIPERYFHFVRSGDARPLEGVLEHNRLDLLSLALVTSHACQLLDEGPVAARGPREALGLGHIYLAGGRADEARRCFAAAGGLDPVSPPAWQEERRVPGRRSNGAEARSHAVTVQAEALRAFALLARRARHFDEAAVAWQRVLALPGCPSHITREATSALAVHYEHRQRDLGVAKAFALRALQIDRGSTREHATRHRVARLDRKLGGRPEEEGGSLF
jgi:uncharacterized protein YprB with RNaseH-like and TPR domain